jgi:hypothetical protein
MDAGEYEAHINWLKDQAALVTKQRASQWIESLLALPDKPKDEQPQQRDVRWDVTNLANTGAEPMYAMLPRDGDGTIVVPRGSYAIDTRNGQNELMFISVWMNREGTRWSVKRYESDTLVSMPRSQQYDILDRIARTPSGQPSGTGWRSASVASATARSPTTSLGHGASVLSAPSAGAGRHGRDAATAMGPAHA